MRFKQFLFFLFLVLTPLLIGANFPKSVELSRNLTTTLFRPFFEASHQFGSWVTSQRQFVVQMFELRKENEALKEKMVLFQRGLASFKEMQQENIRLKQLLKFQQSSNWKFISAQVIARDLSHWAYYVVINKGSKDGIVTEMPVVVGEGLIGKVIGVSADSARVILLIDSESRASAVVQETRDVGLIEGVGQPFLKMTYLDLHAQLKVGQVVVSSGFGGVYPKGLPIGEIIQIGEDQDKMGLYAIVKPYAQFSRLEEVLCIKTGGKK